MAALEGSGAYNSQEPLREGPPPAANRSPRCRARKGGRGSISASLCDGGESGWPCGTSGDHPWPSMAIHGHPSSLGLSRCSAPPHRLPLSIVRGGGASVRSEGCGGQRGLVPALLPRPGPSPGE